MRAYYNEIDPYAAQWLRNLMAKGLIPAGEVDERSITDVQADDLRGFIQCHFFAGIGGWPYALRLAGWPDDRPVWSASLPCQPYSVGSVAHGGAKGQNDERDLWPEFDRLVRELAPATIYGEQVASAIAWGWWDRAALDLEVKGYACAAAVLPAYAVGARHERKRLSWVAFAGRTGWSRHQPFERLPVTEETSFSVYCDPLARAGEALDGDYGDLLSDDGVSVAVERCATKGYGNAIVPEQQAMFIIASEAA